jgi:tetratricopeptide (TPR) repeat protein
MKKHPKLFFCFVPQDRAAVDAIMNELKLQGFTIMEYSDRWQKSDLGKPMPEACADSIDQCTYFVPIVSANSVSPSTGKYAVMEVEYALEKDLQAQHRIVPLVLAQCKPKRWLKPFDVLEKMPFLEINTDDRRLFLQSVSGFCARLDYPYKPRLAERPMLPYWKGFCDEISTAQQSKKLDQDLMPVIAEFNRCFDERDWNQAHFLISFFLQAVQYRHLPAKLFYSGIVKGMCEVELGMLGAAETDLQAACSLKPDDPVVQACIGYLCLRRRDVVAAKECFKTALEKCPSKDGNDLRLYCLVPLVELREPLSAKDREAVLSVDPFACSGDEGQQVLNAQIMILYSVKEYRKAIDLFRSAKKHGWCGASMTMYASFCFKEIGEIPEALSVVNSAVRDAEGGPSSSLTALNFALAELHLSLGNAKEARGIYERRLVSPETQTRKTMIGYARVLKKSNDEKRMTAICTKILKGNVFPPPQNCEDFYYDGYAHYLLGDLACVQSDYERCRRFDSYYSRYEK